MIIDNSSEIRKIVEFKKNCFYKISAIIRSKDFKGGSAPFYCKEKKECILKNWYVSNKKEFEDTLHDSKLFSNVFKCRIYISLDRKDVKKTLLNLRNKISSYLDSFIGSSNAVIGIRAIGKSFSSSASISESSDKDGKRWMFDIDDNEHVAALVEKICLEDYLCTLRTPNGYHVVAKKTFYPNDREFSEIQSKYNVECKSNSMGLVYFNTGDQ